MTKPIYEDSIQLDVKNARINLSWGMIVENGKFTWNHDHIIVRLYCDPRIDLQKPVTNTSLDDIEIGSSKGFTGEIGASVGVVSFTSGVGKNNDISRPALEWSSHQTLQGEFYYRLSIPMSIVQTSGSDISLLSLSWKDIDNFDKLKLLRADIGYEKRDEFHAEYSKSLKYVELNKSLENVDKESAKNIFISYARKDGRDLALRLRSDLQHNGNTVWLDTSEIEGGASWSVEIEYAIEKCDIALTLLSDGSYKSEICRAEQLRCIRKKKRIIPILVQADAERPLHLEHLNYRDFTSISEYAPSFETLLEDLGSDYTVDIVEKHLETYTNAPALPLNFIERPDDRDRLRKELIADDGERRIALTALQGMGGIGKSAMAAWICRDEIVQAAFPDGVIWVDVGRENVNTTELIKLVGTKLGDAMSHYSSETAALSRLRETLPTKSTLIVLDDVWEKDHARLFSDIDAPRSRVLFTTRDSSIGDYLGALEVRLGVLDTEQAIELLQQWAGRYLSEMPEIAERLGYLPLGLKIAGSRLKEMTGLEWLETFRQVSRVKADRRAKSAQDNLQICFDLSVQKLQLEDQLLYHSLGIFKEDLWIPETAAFKLWCSYDPNLSHSDCREIARDFHKLALVERREDDGAMLLHDILHDYNRLRMQERNEYENAHKTFLNHYNVDSNKHWWELDADGYIYQNLVYHLLELQLYDDVHSLLVYSPEWMNAKFIHCNGDSAFVDDLELAMSNYDELRADEDLIKWVELNVARQVINARVSTYDDVMLRLLVFLGRETEAKSYALLRANPEAQFNGLYIIWKASSNSAAIISVPELTVIANAIVDPSIRVLALCNIADNLPQNTDINVHNLYKQAYSIVHNISDPDVIANTLRKIVQGLVKIKIYGEAQEIANSIEDSNEKSWAFRSIVEGLAQDQKFEEAQEIANSIKDSNEKSWAFRSIVEGLAQDQKFEEAQEIVNSIDDHFEESLAWKSIVSNLSKSGEYLSAYEKAKNINIPSMQSNVLATLIGEMKTEDIELVYQTAYNLAHNLSDPSIKMVCFCILAESMAHIGETTISQELYSESHKIAQTFANENNRAWALHTLAKSMMIHSESKVHTMLSQAYEAVQEINNSLAQITSACSLAESIGVIDTDMSHLIYSEAYQITQSFKDDKLKISALHTLAESMVKSNNSQSWEIYSEAYNISKKYVDRNEKSHALSHLSITLSRVGEYYAAYEIALIILDSVIQSQTLSNICIILVQAGMHDMAYTFSQMISDSQLQSQILVAVVEEILNYELFDKAYDVAASISDLALQSDALSKIAIKLMSYGDFVYAFYVAEEVPDRTQKSQILRDFIETLLQNDEYYLALLMTQLIKSPSIQSWAIGTIAEYLYSVGIYLLGQNLVNSLIEKNERSETLGKIVQILAQNKEYKHALDLAHTIPNIDTQSDVLSNLSVYFATTKKYDTAISFAIAIGNVAERSKQLRNIFDYFVLDQKYNDAHDLINEISDRSLQSLLLSKLVEELTNKKDYEMAIKISHEISDDQVRFYSYSTLISGLAEAKKYDLANEILTFIPDYNLQIQALCEIAVTMYRLVENDYVNILSRAREITQKIQNDNVREKLLILMVSTMAKVGMFTEAFKELDSIQVDIDRSTAVIALIEGMTQTHQYEQAFALLDKILDSGLKAQALTILFNSLDHSANSIKELIEQAKKAIETIDDDYLQSRLVALLSTAMVRLKLYDQSIQMLNSVQYPDHQVDVIVPLTEALVKSEQHQKLLDASAEIKDSALQFWMLRAIAEEMIKLKDSNLDEIMLQVIESSQMIRSQSTRIQLLELFIERMEIQRNYSQIIRVVNTINNTKDRNRMLTNVSQSLSKSSEYSVAIQFAHHATDGFQSWILYSIVEDLIKAAQFKFAFEVAETIELEKLKLLGMNLTIEALNESRLYELALEYVQRFENNEERSRVLLKILGSIIMYEEIDMMHNVIQSINDRTAKTDGLLMVVNYLTRKGDFLRAYEYARLISDSGIHSNTLSKIAESLSKNRMYFESFDVFGMQNVEKTIILLCSFQHSIENNLWKKIIFNSLEILCWHREDFIPVREILLNHNISK